MAQSLLNEAAEEGVWAKAKNKVKYKAPPARLKSKRDSRPLKVQPEQ